MNTILMVDDDREMCREMAEILSEVGYTVRTEYDGASGLSAATAEHFDLILLDFKMPGMTGLEVLRELRVRNVDARIIVISGRPFVTSLEEDCRQKEDSKEIVNLADAVFNKPFDVSRVLEKIHELLTSASDFRDL